MDLKLPEPIRLESRTGERLILARSTADLSAFVTVDLERRRWQLGNHPHRMLSPNSRPYQGRGWRENLIEDAARALLAFPGTEGLEASPTDAVAPARPAEPQLHLVVPPQAREDPPEPPARAYAWKVLASGQISQAASATTPEALFQLAGFRPYQVQDPIQGFLAVPVQRHGHAWVEADCPEAGRVATGPG